MKLTDALDDVLASRGHVRLLRALDAMPVGLGATTRELARRSKVAHNRAAEVLDALTQSGLTRRERVGRADVYQLNRDHVLFEALHDLFERESRIPRELEALLRLRLARIAGVTEAYLFGSVARGESRAESDIDLALVMPGRGSTPADEAALRRMEGEVGRRLGSRLAVHVSPKPLAEMVRGRTERDLWRNIAREGLRILPVERARG